jgi:hypothetical protein
VRFIFSSKWQLIVAAVFGIGAANGSTAAKLSSVDEVAELAIGFSG